MFFLQSYVKVGTPVKGVDNVEAPSPAVNKVDVATLTVSKVDASCQVDDPTEFPIEGIQLLYLCSLPIREFLDLYNEKPSEKYWELFAKSRSDMLEDERKKNEKVCHFVVLKWITW